MQHDTDTRPPLDTPWRIATPADPPCSCGLPAVVVYASDVHGEVPSCR